MITKDHYIKRGAEEIHPEDEIFRVKTFIKELSFTQGIYFGKLQKDLGITSKLGEEYLLDYIFNGAEDLEFEDYLETMGKTYQELLD